jgi:outer membrane protein TolC
MIRPFLPWLLVWASALTAVAAEDASPVRPPASTSLNQAVLLALQQNTAVQVQAEGVEIKEGLRQQASGQFDWTFSAGAASERVRTPAVDPLGRTVVGAQDSSTWSVGATRALRNGIILQPQVDVATSRTPAPASGASKIQLQILVPLLRRLGTDSTGAAEAAARGDVEVARLLYRHELATQAFATVSAYWAARAAEDSLAVQRDVEVRAQRLLDSMRVLVGSRVFLPDYLLQAEANFQEKSTIRRSAELTALSARLNLGRVLGLKPEQMAATPVPSDALPVLHSTPAALSSQELADRLVHHALASRADYLAVRQSQVPLAILARQAEKDLKPRVDLSLSGGYAGFDPSANQISPLNERLTGGNARVGVALSWPMRNTYQQGLLHERRATLRQTEAQTALLASGIAADTLTAFAEVRLLSESVISASITAETALKAVANQQNRLRSGESSVIDVINLENLASSARLRLIDTAAGYAIAVARLRFTTGLIFGDDTGNRSFQLQDLTVPPLDEK